MEAQVYKKLHPRKYAQRFLSSGVRSDGRSLSDGARKPVVTAGSIGSALGSAMLKLGRTTVVAGINARLEAPSPNAGDEGTFEVRAEAEPFSARLRSRTAATPPNQILSARLASVLAPHVDLKALCVEKDVLAWRVMLSTYCVDDDGNVADAAVLAAVAALQDLRLPAVSMAGATPDADDGSDEEEDDDDDDVLATVHENRSAPIALDSYPLSVTFALVDGHALLDPSAEEEAVADSMVSLMVRPTGELCSVLKPGGAAVPQSVLRECVKRAAARAPVLAKALAGAARTTR